MTTITASPIGQGRAAREAKNFAMIWIAFVLCVGVVAMATQHLNGWQRMIAISFAMFFFLKAVTLLRESAQGTTLSPPRLVAYIFLWPGMHARSFFSRVHPATRPAAPEWISAMAKVIFGLSLVFGVQSHIESSLLLRAWIGMTGFVFIFHFGLFHLASCIFRFLGIAAEPIMNLPIASRSLAEFWGKRWNLAFRDLSKSLVLHPASRFTSPAVAGFVVFFFSGLIHEAAISYPASGGYGGPLAYFLIQWGGLAAEKQKSVSRILQSLPEGNRVLTLAVTLLPLPLLFHPPFAKEVMLPLLDFVTHLV